MAKAPKLCFDKILPSDLNAPHQQRMTGSGRARAIAPIRKRWANGTRISITFLEGSKANKDMVTKHAPQWTQHANLDFEFTDDPRADIRVSFDANDGAWSYVGTDNKRIPSHAATLNLGWVDEGVILHEFGHMIGLGHEHQNPEGGIVWNEQAVIDALAGPPNFWTEEETRHNVLRKYSADQIHGTDFDPHSIMLYQFPGNWTHNMPGGTSGNEVLSVTDKDFVAGAKMYPGRDTGGGVAVTELPIFEAIPGSIAEPGEEDLYSFTVTKAGVYVIETSGATDLYLSLFGPNNMSSLIGEDDDSGFGRNSRLERNLEPGKYFARVRHFSPTMGGQYEVQVVARRFATLSMG